METNIKDKIEIINSDITYIDLLIKYKLSTIFAFANDIDEAENKRINDYVLAEVPKEINNYKIIKMDDNVVGAYAVREYENGKILDEIYIEENYRNLGIGKYILNSILSSSKLVYLWVYKKNERAIKLYKEFGFKIDSETQSRYFMKYEGE